MSHTFDSQLEFLESRLFLSTTSDTVTVRGTKFSDLMTVDVKLGSRGNKELRVTINGTLRKFDLTGKNNITIESLDGDDQVFVKDTVVRSMLLNGGLGNDMIVAGAGTDRLIGGRGLDTLRGGDGDDFVRGDSGFDSLFGDDGNDRVDGGDGSDSLFGGEGDDQLTGGTGTEQMFGEDGDDVFFSRDTEDDTLAGGDGENSAQRDLAGDIGSNIDFDIS